MAAGGSCCPVPAPLFSGAERRPAESTHERSTSGPRPQSLPPAETSSLHRLCEGETGGLWRSEDGKHFKTLGGSVFVGVEMKHAVL